MAIFALIAKHANGIGPGLFVERVIMIAAHDNVLNAIDPGQRIG